MLIYASLLFVPNVILPQVSLVFNNKDRSIYILLHTERRANLIPLIGLVIKN
jgi:hypothetical protein